MNPRFDAIRAARRPPGRLLRFAVDRWSLAYLAAASVLFIIHWHLPAIQWPLVLLACAMAYGCGCILHDQAHQPMWRSPACNFATECWIVVLRGDGPWSWVPTHIDNHHRFANRPGDLVRTSRWGAADHLGTWLLATVIGLVLYVWAAVCFLVRTMRRRPPRGVLLVGQLSLYGMFITGAWLADPLRAWWLIVVPHGFGLVTMVATAYPQHHRCDPHDPWRMARDFTGRLNNLLHFNHGFHTVHHLDRTLHWSEWPAAHALVRGHLDPRQCEASLPGYLVRTYLLAPLGLRTSQ